MCNSVLVLVTLLVCALVVPAVDAACAGSPLSYLGLPCATTTRYEDNTAGACGCTGGPPSFYPSTYTAAASQAIYNPSDSTVSWCGTGCGSCYELTPTGDCPTGGPCATSTGSIVVMVTNLCPYDGNEVWCPNPGATNQYGYPQHFDLWDQNMDGKISALGWNNPAVTYKQVPCGQLGAPTCTNAGTCTSCSDVSPNCAASGGSSATSAKSTTAAATTAKTSTTGSSSSTTGGSSTTNYIYTSGAYSSSWADWSSTKATSETTHVRTGSAALSYTCNNWNEYYVHVSGSSGITGMTHFSFYLYRTSSTQPLQVLLYLYGATSPVTTSGTAVPTTTVNSWVQVSVTVASLGGSTSSAVGGFAIQAATASNDGTYYIDDIAWS